VTRFMHLVTSHYVTPHALRAGCDAMRCAVLRCTVRGLFAMQCAASGLVAFARCRRRHAFDGGIFRVGFFGFGSTSIRSTVVTGQTEGLKVGCGGMGGRKDGWRNGWIGGRKDGYKGGVWVGFINTNDMYNNDVGKGVVYAYEAYEVK
jgi:hypothetical protein